MREGRTAALAALAAASLVLASCQPDQHVATTRPEPSPAVTGPATTAPPADPVPADRRRPDRDAPLRVLLAGDSVMFDAAEGIVPRLRQTGAATTHKAAGLGTGLTVPWVVHWPSEMRRLVTEQDPEVVVILIGAWDLYPREVGGRTLVPGAPAWVPWYRGLVDEVLDEATAGGAEVVWLGMPRLAVDSDRHVLDVNRVYRAAARDRAGVIYLDTIAALNNTGGFTPYAPDGRGGRVALRKDDGVHLLAPGADRIGSLVQWALAARWRLPVP